MPSTDLKEKRRIRFSQKQKHIRRQLSLIKNRYMGYANWFFENYFDEIKDNLHKFSKTRSIKHRKNIKYLNKKYYYEGLEETE